MIKKIYTAFIIFAISILSIDCTAVSTSSKSILSDNVVLERTQAYSGSSTKSKKLGILEPGSEVIEHKTFIKTKPGLAIMEDAPMDKNVPFDRGAHIYIWEYLEHGFSKIYIHGIPYTTKIARSTTECDIFPPKVKYCWARVIDEPEYYEWKLLSLKEKGKKFWILNRILDGSGIISIRDQAVNVNRITNVKHQNETSDIKNKETTKEIKKVEKAPLFDESMLKDVDIPDDPMAKAFIKNLMKPKSERLKEKRKKELEEKEKAKQNAIDKRKNELKSQEEIFTQQKITKTNLQSNIDNKSTSNTINKVNEVNRPAKKLSFQPNKILVLDPNY